MPKGIVKWYNPNREFGFISSEDGTEMIFADAEKIIEGEQKELRVGLHVQYEISNTAKGKQAFNIKILSPV
ncbi:cold shock domain-containing protein [Pedobacter nototheniae]|uniref:cold-shock protein n=1 Tax=Pedobacter nototheniae TaxID=2488994 RepID=UPI00292D18E6|nr:cold shock domain-containing protein [Pedobacter nototheniae]